MPLLWKFFNRLMHNATKPSPRQCRPFRADHFFDIVSSIIILSLRAGSLGKPQSGKISVGNNRLVLIASSIGAAY